MCKKYLLPDIYFHEFNEVTPALLSSLGVKALLCDIDNTLVTYDDPVPTEAVLRWAGELEKSGVRLALVSNNSAERVECFAAPLRCPAYPDSGKPSKRAYLDAAVKLGVAPSDCAALGDQLFTDVIAAKRCGMKAIIVKPIKDKLTLLFRIKRAGERIIYALYGIKY